MASFLRQFKRGSTSAVRTKIRCVAGDIVSIGTDIIVNAANADLIAGGKHELQKACDEHGGCPTGSAVITPAFRLEKYGTKHIIHAVGPRFSHARAEECDRELMSAYRSALRLAQNVGARSIAIPAISTGVFRFPVERAATLVAEVLSSESFDLDEIVLMALEPEKIAHYAHALA